MNRKTALIIILAAVTPMVLLVAGIVGGALYTTTNLECDEGLTGFDDSLHPTDHANAEGELVVELENNGMETVELNSISLDGHRADISQEINPMDSEVVRIGINSTRIDDCNEHELVFEYTAAEEPFSTSGTLTGRFEVTS